MSVVAMSFFSCSALKSVLLNNQEWPEIIEKKSEILLILLLAVLLLTVINSKYFY